MFLYLQAMQPTRYSTLPISFQIYVSPFYYFGRPTCVSCFSSIVIFTCNVCFYVFLRCVLVVKAEALLDVIEKWSVPNERTLFYTKHFMLTARFGSKRYCRPQISFPPLKKKVTTNVKQRWYGCLSTCNAVICLLYVDRC